MILDVEVQGNAQLMEIAFALSGAGLALGFAKNRQEQAGENCDARNDDQQFQEREPSLSLQLPPSGGFRQNGGSERATAGCQTH
jgi:hypothetical protein